MANAQDQISYTYNTAGLIMEITDTSNDQPVVRFIYDDKGKRLKKESYAAETLAYTDYYVRDASGLPMAIYRDNSLKEHGIYGAGRLGVHKRDDGSDYMSLRTIWAT